MYNNFMEHFRSYFIATTMFLIWNTLLCIEKLLGGYKLSIFRHKKSDKNQKNCINDGKLFEMRCYEIKLLLV